MAVGGERYPSRKKIGKSKWINFGSSGKRTSTTQKTGNRTVTTSAYKTPRVTTNLGHGRHETHGGKSIWKKPRQSKSSFKPPKITAFKPPKAAAFKPPRVKPLPAFRPRGSRSRGGTIEDALNGFIIGALIWLVEALIYALWDLVVIIAHALWLLLKALGWLLNKLFAALFLSSRPEREIEDYDSNELIDDYDEYEPIETRSSSIPPPLPERPPDELIDDYDEDERVEEANENIRPASIPRDDPGWWAPESKGRKRRRRRRR